jgi:SpoVK/Ycf46/Vps4 family AAA+-type ATPase
MRDFITSAANSPNSPKQPDTNKRSRSNSPDEFNDYLNDDILFYKNLDAYEMINENAKELVTVTREINNLIDLIELGKSYDSTKRYNIDLKILSNLVEPLTELNNMIGMESVKQDMVDHILFHIQKLDLEHCDMMHTIIQGPPGVGKTEVAKIIGQIYLAMGILSNNKFIKASRCDLISNYLGQTAKTTQQIIDSAQGGVLFIDEVYALGHEEKKDSFSKECIDTINENLTTKKSSFICIIAGYKDDIEKCFFAYNAGLKRRFPIRFTIDPYSADDLFLIFNKKINDIGWQIDDSINVEFFRKNYDNFKFFGGDMEILFSKCKRSHSRRVFMSTNANKKIINLVDLTKGFDVFKSHQTLNLVPENNEWKNMYN